MINGISDCNSYESHMEACYYSKIIEDYQSFVDNVCQLCCIKKTCESQLEMTDKFKNDIYSRIEFLSKSLGDK